MSAERGTVIDDTLKLRSRLRRSSVAVDRERGVESDRGAIQRGRVIDEKTGSDGANREEFEETRG